LTTRRPLTEQLRHLSFESADSIFQLPQLIPRAHQTLIWRVPSQPQKALVLFSGGAECFG
jgi:hypothetical protein